MENEYFCKQPQFVNAFKRVNSLVKSGRSTIIVQLKKEQKRSQMHYVDINVIYFSIIVIKRLSTASIFKIKRCYRVLASVRSPRSVYEYWKQNDFGIVRKKERQIDREKKTEKKSRNWENPREMARLDGMAYIMAYQRRSTETNLSTILCIQRNK